MGGDGQMDNRVGPGKTVICYQKVTSNKRILIDWIKNTLSIISVNFLTPQFSFLLLHCFSQTHESDQHIPSIVPIVERGQPIKVPTPP